MVTRLQTYTQFLLTRRIYLMRPASKSGYGYYCFWWCNHRYTCIQYVYYIHLWVKRTLHYIVHMYCMAELQSLFAKSDAIPVLLHRKVKLQIPFSFTKNGEILITYSETSCQLIKLMILPQHFYAVKSNGRPYSKRTQCLFLIWSSCRLT